ncbi:AtpZ/AtpI family protein [Helicobacter sp. 23-1044]
MQKNNNAKNTKIAESYITTQNLNVDCHDFATQNLAMTKKTQNLDSANRIKITESNAISQNLIAESTHPLAPSAREGEQNVDSANQTKNAESSEKNTKKTESTPKLRPLIVGANGLSLGISIVVAILLGIGVGVLMQKIFGVFWVLFLGVAWGIAAAILNVYKVYKAELRDFEKIKENPKYKNEK